MNTSEKVLVPDVPDKAAVLGQPPVYYLLTFGISLAIHYLVFPLPLRIPDTSLAPGNVIRIALAVAVAALALRILIPTMLRFKRTGNDPNPHTPTVSIITSGPYRWTRNPIYLGTALLQASLALALGSIWILGSAAVVLLLVHFLAVLPEEGYLERKFGEEYLAYKRSVRRWI